MSKASKTPKKTAKTAKTKAKTAETTKTTSTPGRPSIKTPELLERICNGIAEGKSARTMCLEVGIAQPTLWRWLDDDEAFCKQYARAKELCAEMYVNQIIAIADESDNDIAIDPETGREYTNHDVIARARLRVDARKWYASKLAPKKYGDKIQHGGAEDLPPIQQKHDVTMTPADAYKAVLG